MIRMKILPSTIALALAFLFSTRSVQAQAIAEETFQDIFLTAGYATAFGAALGAASLSFHKEPARHLKIVAVGASIGFIAGSAVGTYLAFNPSLTADRSGQLRDVDLASAYSAKPLTLIPVFSEKSRNLVAVAGAWNVLRF